MTRNARPRTITVADLFEPIDIDFFGTVFRLRTPTRTGEEKAQAKEADLDRVNAELRKRNEAFAEDPDNPELTEAEARDLLMPVFYELLDLLLEPSEDDKGKKTHAKTVVKKLYTDDKIGLVTIQSLIGQIGEARAEERRPT